MTYHIYYKEHYYKEQDNFWDGGRNFGPFLGKVLIMEDESSWMTIVKDIFFDFMRPL